MNPIGLYTLSKREVLRFLKVPWQTFFPPIISALLYLAIFGIALGKVVKEVNGISYLQFLVPGLVMMTIITNAYSNTSFSLFFARFQHIIDDILTAPLSYWEIVTAYFIGGTGRGVIIGAVIALVSLFFVSIPFTNILIIIYFAIAVSMIFSGIGLIFGLWCEKFDHINIFTTFFITPFTYLGGVFYSIDMLPPFLQTITKFNPIFYMINGLRYGMVGVSEVPILSSAIIVGGIAISLYILCIYLFKKGWKLRV